MGQFPTSRPQAGAGATRTAARFTPYDAATRPSARPGGQQEAKPGNVSALRVSLNTGGWLDECPSCCPDQVAN